MATILTTTYSSNTAITFDVSSLSASSTFIVGRESTQVDNTSNKYIDALVDIKGITAGASSNTVGQEMRLYCWGSDVSLATTPIEAFDGTDAAVTTTATVLQSLRLAGAVSAVVTTANLVYYFQPFSVASLFGGIMPKFWGLYFTTSMTGGTAASMTGKFQYTGITYTNT
jgi:hypothetical protein